MAPTCLKNQHFKLVQSCAEKSTSQTHEGKVENQRLKLVEKSALETRRKRLLESTVVPYELLVWSCLRNRGYVGAAPGNPPTLYGVIYPGSLKTNYISQQVLKNGSDRSVLGFSTTFPLFLNHGMPFLIHRYPHRSVGAHEGIRTLLPLYR